MNPKRVIPPWLNFIYFYYIVNRYFYWLCDFQDAMNVLVVIILTFQSTAIRNLIFFVTHNSSPFLNFNPFFNVCDFDLIRESSCIHITVILFTHAISIVSAKKYWFLFHCQIYIFSSDNKEVHASRNILRNKKLITFPSPLHIALCNPKTCHCCKFMQFPYFNWKGFKKTRLEIGLTVLIEFYRC